MARVEVVCEIESDGSVKAEIESPDREQCAAEAKRLKDLLAAKPATARTQSAVIDERTAIRDCARRRG